VVRLFNAHFGANHQFSTPLGMNFANKLST